MLAKANSIRVLVVEPLTLIREALKGLLNRATDITVVAESDSFENVGRTIHAAQIDLALVVIDALSESALALLSDVPEQCRVLILTMDRESAYHARAVELGAKGIVMKDQTSHVLVKAVRKVHAGEMWLDRAGTAVMMKQLTRRYFDVDPEAAKVEALTTREREIVTLVSDGLRNKEIAERLFISETTVRNHLTSILNKLELNDRFQLAVYTFRKGLVVCAQTPATMRMATVMSSEVARRARRR